MFGRSNQSPAAAGESDGGGSAALTILPGIPLPVGVAVPAAPEVEAASEAPVAVPEPALVGAGAPVAEQESEGGRKSFSGLRRKARAAVSDTDMAVLPTDEERFAAEPAAPAAPAVFEPEPFVPASFQPAAFEVPAAPAQVPPPYVAPEPVVDAAPEVPPPYVAPEPVAATAPAAPAAPAEPAAPERISFVERLRALVPAAPEPDLPVGPDPEDPFAEQWTRHALTRASVAPATDLPPEFVVADDVVADLAAPGTDPASLPAVPVGGFPAPVVTPPAEPVVPVVPAFAQLVPAHLPPGNPVTEPVATEPAPTGPTIGLVFADGSHAEVPQGPEGAALAHVAGVLAGEDRAGTNRDAAPNE